MRRSLFVFCAAAALVLAIGSAQASVGVKHGKGHGHGKSHGTVTMSVFATGFNNPRGLTFGPDGKLYVAEGGLGGTHNSFDDACPYGQAHGDAAPYFGSTNDPVMGGRVSKVDRHGHVSTVVDALPSSQTSPAIGSLVSGVSSVAFVGHRLYGLLAGAGCSHGVPTIPNGVFRVGHGGNWSLIADLSAWRATHPVANPDDDDLEPDGTWYSMIASGGALYPMDSNQGELDHVTGHGDINRVVDISAQLGHVVPTAIAQRHAKKHHGRGFHHHGQAPDFFIGNLGVFGPPDGDVPNESVWKLGHNGTLTQKATGLEQVLGLAFRGGKLYALEMSTTPGGPTPGTGAIVRVRGGHPAETIVSGLVFPTGMTIGHDGAFYVSENGFGFPAGEGRIIRITTGHHH